LQGGHLQITWNYGKNYRLKYALSGDIKEESTAEKTYHHLSRAGFKEAVIHATNKRQPGPHSDPLGESKLHSTLQGLQG
jgi:hypothetical protein